LALAIEAEATARAILRAPDVLAVVAKVLWITNALPCDAHAASGTITSAALQIT